MPAVPTASEQEDRRGARCAAWTTARSMIARWVPSMGISQTVVADRSERSPPTC